MFAIHSLVSWMSWNLSFDTFQLMSRTLISFFPDPEPISHLSSEEIEWVLRMTPPLNPTKNLK